MHVLQVRLPAGFQRAPQLLVTTMGPRQRHRGKPPFGRRQRGTAACITRRHPRRFTQCSREIEVLRFEVRRVGIGNVGGNRLLPACPKLQGLAMEIQCVRHLLEHALPHAASRPFSRCTLSAAPSDPIEGTGREFPLIPSTRGSPSSPCHADHEPASVALFPNERSPSIVVGTKTTLARVIHPDIRPPIIRAWPFVGTCCLLVPVSRFPIHDIR